nr:KR domain-containing protein [Streptomyces sp. SS52]
MGDAPAALAAALSADEPQTALRDGTVLGARLTRVRPGDRDTAAPWDPEGTVIVTGGTGGLGAVLARHLVAEHGVRHLLLAGRRGPDAPGAAELRAEPGVRGRGDPRGLRRERPGRGAAAVRSVPADHPVTGVVHTAGTLDDGLVESLTEER